MTSKCLNNFWDLVTFHTFYVPNVKVAGSFNAPFSNIANNAHIRSSLPSSIPSFLPSHLRPACCIAPPRQTKTTTRTQASEMLLGIAHLTVSNGNDFPSKQWMVRPSTKFTGVIAGLHGNSLHAMATAALSFQSSGLTHFCQ